MLDPFALNMNIRISLVAQRYWESRTRQPTIFWRQNGPQTQKAPATLWWQGLMLWVSRAIARGNGYPISLATDIAI
jgi:hypothetical protein